MSETAQDFCGQWLCKYRDGQNTQCAESGCVHRSDNPNGADTIPADWREGMQDGQVATLNIMGQDVALIISNEPDIVSELQDLDELGRCELWRNRIIIQADLDWSYMRCVLWHEVREYIRVHMGLDYENYGGSEAMFDMTANWEWAAMKANADLLTGDKLKELVDELPTVQE